MSFDQSFPRELLNQPPAVRLDYFRTLTIGHPLLLRAYDDVHRAICDSEQGSIILVQGPAGVGKTTLFRKVEKDFCEQLLPVLTQDVGRFPAIRMEAMASDSESFNWDDYLRRLIIALGEPESLIHLGVSRAGQNQFKTTQPTLATSSHSSYLPYKVEQVLRYRNPLAVLVDDVQHLGSGSKFLHQISILKLLASLTRTTHILMGTYEQSLSSQMNIGMEIEFKRYSIENEEHQEAFINCLRTFQMHLPLIRTPDLIIQWEYFYERSIGCIGVLKDWLIKALAQALEDGGKTLTYQNIQRYAPSVTKCMKMLAEAVDGERKFTSRLRAQGKQQGIPRLNIGVLSVVRREIDT
jgi:hypothetical protein